MCNKCENYHSEIFQNHHLFNLDQKTEEIFTGFCKEENHSQKLDYFYKTHNSLCCAACLSKIKSLGNGQHTDCQVCETKDILAEKRNNLKDNVKYLEDFSNSIQNSIKELKIMVDKFSKNKEELKLKIQNIFTKIRNVLNNREDELLLEVDNTFNKLYFNEDLIKECDKLPNNIKASLEKGKKIDNEWNDNNNNINNLVNDCINIENNIKKIKEINESIKKCKNTKSNVKFIPENFEIENNETFKLIKNFGKISQNRFKFKKCPININKDREFTVTGEEENILTKTGTDSRCIGSICEYQLEKDREYSWKIKILNTRSYQIFVGVSTIDFDPKTSSYLSSQNCGWYFFIQNSTLYSGPPFNYQGKGTNINIKKANNEITVIMNMKKRTLKFIIDNDDKGDSYTDIPIDKPIVPSVMLYNINDSREIVEC